MRKQELVHLHGLTVELRRYLEERSELPVESFVAEEGGAGPMAIHRRKEAHEVAVRRALTDIVGAIESTAWSSAERPTEPPTPDD